MLKTVYKNVQQKIIATTSIKITEREIVGTNGQPDFFPIKGESTRFINTGIRFLPI